MQLRSSAFEPDGPIPRRHTCEGEDLAPALSWSPAPPGTVSFALVMDDPDAGEPGPHRRPWVHWVLWDLPATVHSLPEGATPLPDGAHEGLNSWDERGWNGPCPPSGRHHYRFRLHALDRRLGPIASPTRAALEEAMRGHVLGVAELVGTYQRQWP